MKYPNWNEYDNAKKWKAVADEVKLETNNGTTKADLTNMVKFLSGEAARLQAEAIKAEAEVERLQKSYAITNKSWQNLQAENAKLRKLLCERVADENDKLQTELALLRKLAQATWEYFNDPEIINDADIEDALAEYETWKEEADD